MQAYGKGRGPAALTLAGCTLGAGYPRKGSRRFAVLRPCAESSRLGSADCRKAIRRANPGLARLPYQPGRYPLRIDSRCPYKGLTPERLGAGMGY